MTIIDSSWFLNKLKAASDKPEQTLLAVFDLLSEMPDHEQLPENPEIARTVLPAYLTQQAKDAGLQAPELLAQQIYHMANNALIQQQANPGSNALHHAKQAAAALIQVQRKPGWLQIAQQYVSAKPFQYGLAASLFMLGATGIVVGYQGLHAKATPEILAVAETDVSLDNPQNTNPDASMASPADTAEMYTTIEKMRDGRCHYIEALQLPTAQQGVYLQNVIAGQVSSKASDQKMARELMSKVSCDYTPMLMKNSTG
ncbi:MAG TPA: hypothetical protein VGC12_06970 [Methyloradius sp.]